MTKNKNFWNERVRKFGHTGLNHPYIYPWEQKNRLRILNKIVKKTTTKKEKKIKILDFGCGDGKLGINFSKNINPEVIYHCFDISNKCLFLAKKNILKNKFREFKLYKKLPELEINKNEKYDFILLITVIQHMDNLNSFKTLRILKEKLKDDGKIIILDNCYGRPSKSEHIRTNWDKEIIINHFKTAGLKNIRTYKHISNLFFITEYFSSNLNYLRKNPIFKFFIYLPILILFQVFAIFADIFLLNIFKTTYTWFIVE